jgi:hypothetical protein
VAIDDGKPIDQQAETVPHVIVNWFETIKK